jgi:ACS family hexuronate transporter-like MFS transporter
MAKVQEAVYPYRWAILVVVSAIYTMAYVSRAGVPAINPFLKDYFELTSSQVGLMMTFNAMGMLTMSLPSGILVDLLGPKRMFLIGLLTATVGVLACSFATSFPMFLGFWFLTGMGCGCLQTGTTKAVTTWFPTRERATAMGIKQLQMSLGGLIGGATLPTLCLAFTWRFGFQFVAMIIFAAFLIALTLYKDPPKPATTSITPEAATPRLTRKVAKSIFFDRDILMLATISFLLGGTELSVVTHLTVYLRDIMLMSAVVAGMCYAVMEVAGGVSRPIIGLISDRLFRGKRKTVLLLAVAICFAVVMIIAFMPSGTPDFLLYIIFAFFGLAGFGWVALYLTLVAEFAGRELTGLAVGYAGIINFLGVALVPLFFGMIVDAAGSYRPAWLLLGALLIICLAAVASLKEERRKI